MAVVHSITMFTDLVAAVTDAVKWGGLPSVLIEHPDQGVIAHAAVRHQRHNPVQPPAQFRRL